MSNTPIDDYIKNKEVNMEDFYTLVIRKDLDGYFVSKEYLQRYKNRDDALRHRQKLASEPF